MGKNDEVWPADRGELTSLLREADEHRRAWGIVRGLCKTLDSERQAKPYPSSEQQNARIHALEEKIVKQRRFLAQIEDCRAFEKETEGMLVAALMDIAGGMKNPKAAAASMVEHWQQRRGPRPEAEES